MHYKFKVDIGVKEYVWLIFMIIVIMGIFSFAGAVFAIATSSEEASNFFIGIGCFVDFIYVIKFFIESVFIIPANEYEKSQIIKEEEKNK